MHDSNDVNVDHYHVLIFLMRFGERNWEHLRRSRRCLSCCALVLVLNQTMMESCSHGLRFARPTGGPITVIIQMTFQTVIDDASLEGGARGGGSWKMSDVKVVVIDDNFYAWFDNYFDLSFFNLKETKNSNPNSKFEKFLVFFFFWKLNLVNQ